MNEKLRKEVKMLKAFQNISYKEIAERLGIRVDSFYSWLRKSYDLGEEKQQKLNKIIQSLKEE